MTVEDKIIDVCKKRAGINWEYYGVVIKYDRKTGIPNYVIFQEMEKVGEELVPTGKSKGASPR